MKIKNKKGLVETNLELAAQLFRVLLPTVPREMMELDLTMAQLKIALLLFLTGPKRMSAIASEMDITLPTTTTFVDKLVEKGYVSREGDAEDRRVVLSRLSEEGEKAINRMWESAKERSRELLEQLDEEKLQMFAAVLNDMLSSANDQELSNKTKSRRKSKKSKTSV